MHEPEGVAEEMFDRDLSNFNLRGEGSRANPICSENEGDKLTADQIQLIENLAKDYRRALVYVSGKSLCEFTPLDASGQATTPDELEQNARQRAARNN